jgi:hypothetical protein
MVVFFLLIILKNSLDKVHETIEKAEKQVQMSFKPLFMFFAFPYCLLLAYMALKVSKNVIKGLMPVQIQPNIAV